MLECNYETYSEMKRKFREGFEKIRKIVFSDKSSVDANEIIDAYKKIESFLDYFMTSCLKTYIEENIKWIEDDLKKIENELNKLNSELENLEK